MYGKLELVKKKIVEEVSKKLCSEGFTCISDEFSSEARKIASTTAASTATPRCRRASSSSIASRMKPATASSNSSPNASASPPAVTRAFSRSPGRLPTSIDRSISASSISLRRFSTAVSIGGWGRNERWRPKIVRYQFPRSRPSPLVQSAPVPEAAGRRSRSGDWQKGRRADTWNGRGEEAVRAGGDKRRDREYYNKSIFVLLAGFIEINTPTVVAIKLRFRRRICCQSLQIFFWINAIKNLTASSFAGNCYKSSNRGWIYPPGSGSKGIFDR